MRRALPFLLVGLMCAGCGKEAMKDFVSNFMHPEFNVDYANEGKIFVLINNCLEHGAGTDAYKSCTVKWGPTGPIDTDAVGVDVLPFEPDQVNKAVPYAREYQWITVNPSFSSISGAVIMAATQLKIMGSRGVVLVYLPQGPDVTRVNYDDYESKWDEANRYMCGGWKQTFEVFQRVLGQLVDGVTQPDVREGGELVRTILVSGYSYSSHQVLEAIRDKPNAFFLNVAPSFGMQQWRGDPDHDIGGSDCNPYSARISFHELDFEKYPNPHVATYIDNLATSQVPQCILGSYGDCTSLSFRGLSLTHPDKFGIGCKDADPPPDIVRGWDPFDPARTPYIVRAPTQWGGNVFLCADPARWNEAACWGSVDQAGQYLYGRDERIVKAISANLQTYNSIRLFRVRTPSFEEDLTWDKALTENFGTNASVGHFGYWMNGSTPNLAEPPPNMEERLANWHIKDNISACIASFVDEETPCPACDDADDWANGRNPEPASEIYWLQEPRGRREPPERHPENRVKTNDVVFVPTNATLPETLGMGGLAQALDELGRKWGPVAGESMHVSAMQNLAMLQMRTVPPAARGVSRVVLSEDGTTGIMTDYCPNSTPETVHAFAWDFPRLFGPAGQYSDLVGAWVDLENQWRDDHGCGPDATDYSSGKQRVLVMKLTVPPRAQDGSFMTSFAQPIPDIRGGDVPATVVSNERISVDVQVYVHPAGTLGDVVALAGSGATPIAGTVVGDSCVDGDCALKGRVVDYRFEWNVHDTWCASRANDSSCGGTEYRAEPLLTNFRIRAYNGAGNYFRHVWPATISRCEDCDADGVRDDVDRCAGSNLATTIVIGTCDTGVRNRVSATGCSVLDEFARLLSAPRLRGSLVSDYAGVVNRLAREGVIRRDEVGPIIRCAARTKPR